MGYINKGFCILLATILTASSLIFAGVVFAQAPKPAVTEFSLQYVDNSYDVPPSSKSTTDIYGQVTTTTIPGYRAENKSIVATIKNPPGVDAYNFRWKPHNDSRWHYHPFDTEADQIPPLAVSGSSGPPAYASDSEYTVISIISNHLSVASLDVQVMALYGDYRAVHNSPLLLEGDYYDYYFDGQASYWSNTQTINIGNEMNSSPTATAPPTTSALPSQQPTATPQNPLDGGRLFNLTSEQAALAVAVVVIAALAVAVVVLWRKKVHPEKAMGEGLVAT
jgi:hypothetical protein